MAADLSGKVALVAGATRGCGRAIAVELARAGAYVYATGRSSRTTGRSEMNRPETIEETGEIVAAAGGAGAAVRIDHLEPGEVSALVARINAEQGRLDILVNDIFGGDAYMQGDKKLWEHDLPGGLRMLRMGIDTHLITAALALPLVLRHPGGLVIEMTDGTIDYNRKFRDGVGFYYDLIKAAVERITTGGDYRRTQRPAVHRARGYPRLAALGGHARSLRRHRGQLARCDRARTALLLLRIPLYVARGIVALAADPGAGRHAGETLTSGQLGRIYGVTDVDGSRPDGWRYITEIEVPGLPARETGYR